MAAYRLFAYLALVTLTFSAAYATDPTQLQDFCVATKDPINGLFVNGLFCKNPMAVTAEDFVFNGLDKPGNTENRLGSAVTPVDAGQLAGLNTLSISIARLDFAPYGLVAPHIHPRATEVLTLLEGTLYVGFVASNPPDNGKNKFFTKVLNKGDVFVFPQGLIHFQLNVGKSPAFAMSSLNSQNPGRVTIGNTVFGSDPAIPVDVLSKAFQLDANVIKQIQAKFAMTS